MAAPRKLPSPSTPGLASPARALVAEPLHGVPPQAGARVTLPPPGGAQTHAVAGNLPSVDEIIRRAGRPLSQREISQRQMLCQLWLENVRSEDIAEAIGISEGSAVRALATRMGLPPRSSQIGQTKHRIAVRTRRPEVDGGHGGYVDPPPKTVRPGPSLSPVLDGWCRRVDDKYGEAAAHEERLDAAVGHALRCMAVGLPLVRPEAESVE